VGFRQNLYGKFAVHVGVYVPEFQAYGYAGGGKLSFIHEYDGWVRERLGILGPERQDLWWDLKAVPEQAAEVFRRIERDALPFLAKFETRDAILNPWMQESTLEEDIDFSRFTRSRQNLACAIILAVRGRRHEAKSLLRAALLYDPNHPSSARIRSFLEELELKE
jgi:Domain of unknown function (DUF4304)